VCCAATFAAGLVACFNIFFWFTMSIIVLTWMISTCTRDNETITNNKSIYMYYVTYIYIIQWNQIWNRKQIFFRNSSFRSICYYILMQTTTPKNHYNAANRAYYTLKQFSIHHLHKPAHSKQQNSTCQNATKNRCHILNLVENVDFDFVLRFILFYDDCIICYCISVNDV
jgi:hypothetical protein